MHILGLSAFYHDSAAVLVNEGRIIAAAQEECFTRKKHDSRFPKDAIAYCLKEGGIELDQLANVVFYDKPLLKFERLLETYLSFAPNGFKSFSVALPLWIREKLFQKQLLIKELSKFSSGTFPKKKILFTEHHHSHAASAFFPSPFEEAVVLTMDGVGEWATTSVAIGRGNNLEIIKEIHFPHSLGLLYSAFTYYTGFKVNSGEYKVMGLAPYGEPKYKDKILNNLVHLQRDGSFRLDQSYFNYCTGLTMTNKKFDDLFGGPPRKPEEKLTQHHMDLAASIQSATEEVVLRLTRHLAAETQCENLCMAGGVAFNCVANGKILRDGSFKNIWIQPAAGDAGGALGAALTGHYHFLGNTRKTNGKDTMQGAFLGPSFSSEEIERRLSHSRAKFTVLNEEEIIKITAQKLADGKVVGWFQGRLEFGPRALGNRSILADPRSKTMQTTLNLKVKNRESFRPFAPSVLREDVADWFDLDTDSPYMLFTADVIKNLRKMTEEEATLFGIDKLKVIRSGIPAVTHVDYSARIQTVHKETNPRYHGLISQFKKLTGCPVIVNTSFNIRGEPIVCTPEEAFRCFMGTDIDVLVIGHCILEKEKQDASLKVVYKDGVELD